MPASIEIQQLSWKCSPLDIVAVWPGELPLVMLHSGRLHNRWARWSVLAQPRGRYRFSGHTSQWFSDGIESPISGEFTHDPVLDLELALTSTLKSGTERCTPTLPFCGGWIGYLSYDLGERIEPRAVEQHQPLDDRGWPLIDLAWCPDALVYDHLQRTWHQVGVDFARGSIAAILERQLAHTSRRRMEGGNCPYSLSSFQPHIAPENYMQAVRRTIEYIAAGDIFQANIAQRFTAEFSGSTRALALAAFNSTQPFYGGYLELPDQRHDRRRCILSLSPELFLNFDASSRLVTTRPIKGTSSAHHDARILGASQKDSAELHMIIDLMRNDLGRVCEVGSIRVPNAREIETHPTVHHGVGEVIGRLRPHCSPADLLKAAFPAGSITGAPKIRAMQIIQELEPVRRGPYCGAIGMFSACGNVNLNVAIRTLLLSGDGAAEREDFLHGAADYLAGAGIVADSTPLAEYRETLVKCAILERLSAKASIPTRVVTCDTDCAYPVP